MSGVSYPPTSQAAIQAAVAGVAALIPSASTVIPAGETTAGSVGAAGQYAPAMHSHPRLTSTTLATLGTGGVATVAFTRSFMSKPGVVLTEVESTNPMPLSFQVNSYVMTGALYTGAIIKGYRPQLLPTLSAASPSILLTALVTLVNAVNTALSAFNLFGGSAVGAEVSVVAIARSDV